MIRWLFCFVLGLPMPEGKTGKREVAGVCFTLWCYGFVRLGVLEAQDVDMPLTADVLRYTFPFVGLLVLASFGMEQLVRVGWFRTPRNGQAGSNRNQRHGGMSDAVEDFVGD